MTEKSKSKSNKITSDKTDTVEESEVIENKKYIPNTLKKISVEIKNGIFYNIKNTHRKNAEAMFLGLILTLILGLLPFIWLPIAPVVFNSNQGINFLFVVLISSIWIGDNLGKQSENNVTRKYFITGVLISYFIQLLINIKYGITGSIFFLFTFLIIIIMVGTFMAHRSVLSSDKIRGNLNILGILSLSISLLHYASTGFIIPYFKNTSTGFIGFTVFLFSLLVYLGVMSPIFTDIKRYIQGIIKKYSERKGEIKISNISMKDRYIKTLAENDIIYQSQLDEMEVEDLMEINGITRYDAQMILTFVYDLEDNYFLNDDE